MSKAMTVNLQSRHTVCFLLILSSLLRSSLLSSVEKPLFFFETLEPQI